MDSNPESNGARPPDPRGRIRPRHLILLLILLVAPGLALHRLSAFIPFPWLLAYALIISLVTYALYGADQDSAADPASQWRAPEKLLHALELAGGWPGAFLAQRRLRHKCSKLTYQVVFWLIVALHVYASTDYLLDWRVARAVRSHYSHRSPEPPAP
jgi:uncharacterized membrane protein YsdA (DUF1294 family)